MSNPRLRLEEFVLILLLCTASYWFCSQLKESRYINAVSHIFR